MLRLPQVGEPRADPTPDARGSKPCELPPPSGAGRLYTPPHPIFAIAFVYVVSIALVWGALSRPGDPSLRLAVVCVGLCLCLVAAVHWLEAVEPAHIAAKLGLSRTPQVLWAVAAAGTIPGIVATGLALAGRGGGAGAGAPEWSAGGAPQAFALLAATVWTEAFHRGFVFRGLMRRHGFFTAAGTSAVLLAGATLLVTNDLLGASRAALLAVTELPLSFALCALFWLRGPTLAPGMLVRLSVLAAAACSASAWPAVAAAVLVLLPLRVLSRARRA